jgi:hypothetical protein
VRFLTSTPFRHAYISTVVNSGASVKVAQELARHSSPTLSIGRYSHTRLHGLRGPSKLYRAGQIRPTLDASRSIRRKGSPLSRLQVHLELRSARRSAQRGTLRNRATSGEQSPLSARGRTQQSAGDDQRKELPHQVDTTSGGHGARTRNPLRGTTFPVWPLTIRLPSVSRR